MCRIEARSPISMGIPTLASLVIEVDGLENINIIGRSILTRFSEPVVQAFFLGKLSPYFREQFGEAFEVSGRKSKWEPLADRTVQNRLDEGYPPGPPLVKTGDLSARVGAFEGAYVGQLFTIPSVEETAGFGKYVGHQLGAPYGGGNPTLPQRKMVEVADQDIANVLALANEYFIGGLYATFAG